MLKRSLELVCLHFARSRKYVQNGTEIDTKNLSNSQLGRSSQPELLNGILAGGHLRGEDAKNRDHGHAPVVQLLHPHLVVVHVHAEGVAVIARLFLRVLPPPQLQWGASEEDAEEAEHALALVHDGEARRRILEERELDEMLCDEPNRSHHRYSTMLDLGDTQLPKALLVAHLGKPEWIKESKRLGGAELLGRLEERRCILLNDGLSPSHHALCSHDS